MQHKHSDGGETHRGRWPLEHGPSGDPSTQKMKIGSGRGAATHQAAVPHARWNNSEWRRWDQNHGHMLWMGTLQEGWSNATIAGFFRHHGEEVKVTRKGQDNYCFVEFATAEKATDFMKEYNHRLLPGKHGNGIRFSIKPRTRPRWYREAEPGRKEVSQGDDNDNGNYRDLRHPRVEPYHDRRGGGRRPTFAEAKTETRSQNSYQDYHVRGAGANTPEGRGYYGQGVGVCGPHVADSGRRGCEERSPRTTPPSRQQAIANEGGDLARRGSCKDPRGAFSRSRLWPGESDNDSILDRSRPTSRMLSRLGPSPPRRSCSGERSRRNKRSPDGCRTRRRQDPSCRQTGITFDCVVGDSVASNAGRIPAAAATRAGSLGGEGSETLPLGGRNKLPRDSVTSGDTIERDKRGDAMNTAPVNRTEGSARRRPAADSGRAGRGRAGSGGGKAVEAAGRKGQNSPTSSIRSGSLDDSATESDDESDHAVQPEDSPEQGIISQAERGFPGVQQKTPAVLSTTPESDGRSSETTVSPGQAACGIQLCVLGRENAVEECPGWKRNSLSPGTAGGRDAQAPRKQSSPRPATRYSDYEQLNQGSTRSNDASRSTAASEASPSTAARAEGVRGVGFALASHVRDNASDEDEFVQDNLDPTDDLQSQPSGNGTATLPAVVSITTDVSGTVNRQPSGVLSAPALPIDSGSPVASDKGAFHELDDRDSRQERGTLSGGTKGKGSLQRDETRRSGKISTAPLTGPSPNVQAPPRELCHQTDTGLYVAPRTGSTFLFCDGAGRLDRAGAFVKGASTKDTARHATPTRDESVLDTRPSAGDRGSAASANQTPLSNRSIEASPGVEDKLTGDGCDGCVSQNVSTPKFGRGTKRRISSNANLTKVAAPPTARQRLEERVLGSTRSVAEQDLQFTNVAPARVVVCADTTRGKARSSHGKDPSMASASDVSSDGSAVWAKGRASPFTGMPAPHENLVTPLLANDPEGRRVAIRTAAAVTAGAAMLALPQYHLEVTGLCGDGLLLELCPKHGGKGPLVQKSGVGTSAMLYSLADRLQAAFDGVVALDLQFDGVQLPHSEALKTVAAGSSIEKLIKWNNEGTASLLRLAPAPPSRGTPSAGQAPGDAESTILLELRKALECAGGTLFIGCDNSSRRLLPRSGLLKSCKVDIHPVVYPPLESAGGGSRAYQHLALTLSDSREALKGRGSPRAVRGADGQSTLASGGGLSGAAVFGLPQLSSVARLACGPPTCTAEGLTWRDVTNLRCVADVNRLILGPRTELDNKLRLAEGLHSAQIETLAKKIAFSSTLLVVLAGREGASTDFVASRLCVDLRVRGKTSAMLDTKKFLRPGNVIGQGQHTANPAAPFSCRQLDSAALRRAIAALLGHADVRDGVRSITNAGGGSVVGGNGNSGMEAETRKWCDVVVVFGCEMLNFELLPPSGFGLGPTEAMSVFVDILPQVSIDNLTAVDGADVRMLRALLAAAKAAETGFAHDGDIGSFTNVGSSSRFDTAGFLQEWFVAEQGGESLWRSFHATANFHVNTSLPYDLNALKPKAEPLLRSVTPPVDSCQDEDNEHGSRRSAYALSRSVMRLLGLCESLYAPQLPGRSVLSGLTVA